jgi:hypothetical protein
MHVVRNPTEYIPELYVPLKQACTIQKSIGIPAMIVFRPGAVNKK